MTDEPSEEGAEASVARSDPDRYVASLFASPGRRAGLIALYFFNSEVARIRELLREPMVGHIRLGWWREQIAAIYEQRKTAMPLVQLRQAIDVFALPRDLFETYLDARSLDFSETPFADEAALEAYASATAGSLMKLAARVCGAGGDADQTAHHAAHATAYAGFIRSIGFDATHRFCRLPLSWLEAEGLNAEDVFAATTSPPLRKVVERFSAAARGHLASARASRFPRTAIAALAPATLVQSYLKRATDGDIFGKPIEVSQIERTARIAWTTLSGRI